MATTTRQRMISSAALLMREQGVQGTAFSDVLEHAGAPRGSVYHHFPDGKAQLIEEATEFAGDYIADGIVRALAERDAVGALRQFAAQWRDVLTTSEFNAGCPVAAAALEGREIPGARDSAGRALSRWIDLLATALASQGLPAARAGALATLVIASIEGAIVIARAQQSIAPFDLVATQLELILADDLS